MKKLTDEQFTALCNDIAGIETHKQIAQRYNISVQMIISILNPRIHNKRLERLKINQNEIINKRKKNLVKRGFKAKKSDSEVLALFADLSSGMPKVLVSKKHDMSQSNISFMRYSAKRLKRLGINQDDVQKEWLRNRKIIS